MLSLKLLVAYLGEGLLMAYVGTGCLSIKLKAKNIFIIGVTFGLCIYFIRSAYSFFHIPLGTHTIILSAILVLLFKFVGKLYAIESAIAMFICQGLSVFGETVILLPYITHFQIQFTEELLDSWTYVLMAYISYIPMIVMGIIITARKFRMMNLSVNMEGLG